MNPNDEFNFEKMILDESFQNWVTGRGTATENAYWEQWTLRHASHQQEIDEGARIIERLSHAEEPVNPALIRASWRQLQKRISAEVAAPKKQRLFTPLWTRYAAAVVLVALAGIYFTTGSGSSSDQISYSTNYGEQRTIDFDDGSEVVLNANTRIQIASGEFNRQVTLVRGEAFFTISKTVDHAPFFVRTDSFDVRVLGTEFNIDLSRQQQSVMLREGSIALHTDNQQIIMKPGQLATLQHNKIAVKRVNTHGYDAWLDNKFIFNNTSLEDIAALMKIHYGITVQLDPEVRDKKLSGEIPNKDPDILLQAIRVTHNLEVLRNGETIQIRKKD